MLTELRLQALGVVADATLEFGPGLTALTGETGAGKTMIVAGLGLLLGNRADAGIVRNGAPRALVEGRWLVPSELAEQVRGLGGDLDEDELIAGRQVGSSGRSRAALGGIQVPVSTLGSLLEQLATIHGQSGQIRLAAPEHQRQILDQYAQPARLEQYRRDHAERVRLAAELEVLLQEADARRREAEVLRYGLEEIAATQPVEGEDRLLATEAVRLQDADGLKLLATAIRRALAGDDEDFEVPGAVSLLDEARKLAERLGEADESAAGLAERLREASYVLHDLVADVAGYAADLVTDPIRLEAVAERRAALAALTRRYGPDLVDVLAWADAAQLRLTELGGADGRIEVLRARLEELEAGLEAAADEISADRSRAARELAGTVGTELAALAMPHATLTFEVTPGELGPHGRDHVELMFRPNPGSRPAPLGRIASGGELSRVRLALEAVLASGTKDQTFVFDEVDAGVGGAVGLEIGRRLRRLARNNQVIVVTHLPQVAAFANRHFVISKSSDGNVTTSDVTELTEQDRAAELSRMMGGLQDSDAGIEHAADLLDRARALALADG